MVLLSQCVMINVLHLARRTCLMIQSCIIYPNQHPIHSQEKAQQQEETSGHHPLQHEQDTPRHHEAFLFKQTE